MQDQRIGSMLWQGKWPMLLSLVLSVALAVLITQKTAKVYSATATLQVDSPRSADDGGGAETRAATYAALINDRSFLEKIAPRVSGGIYTASDLKSHVDGSAVEDTALLRITVTESSPAVARTLALAFAKAFVATVKRDASLRAKTERRQIAAQIAALSNQIETVAAERGADSPDELRSLRLERDALTAQLAVVAAGRIAEADSIGLTAAPAASATPVRPRPVLNVLAGLMLGLLVGVVLAWLRTRLDRGLRSAEEAEELLAAPMLAAIPIRRRFSPDAVAVGEAHDALRAKLASLSLDQAVQVVTFTSYNAGEGKTSTVEGLAYAGVRGGMNVLIVDGDTRTAALSTRLGARGLPGLTSVISGEAPLEDAVFEVEPGLALLPAGPTPPNAGLLVSARLRELLAELRERHGLIVIDSPPVAKFPDALFLAGVSDGVVLVARVGLTNRGDLTAAIAKLRQSPTPLVGSVLLTPQEGEGAHHPASPADRLEVGEAFSRP